VVNYIHANCSTIDNDTNMLQSILEPKGISQKVKKFRQKESRTILVSVMVFCDLLYFIKNAIYDDYLALNKESSWRNMELVHDFLEDPQDLTTLSDLIPQGCEDFEVLPSSSVQYNSQDWLKTVF